MNEGSSVHSDLGIEAARPIRGWDIFFCLSEGDTQKVGQEDTSVRVNLPLNESTPGVNVSDAPGWRCCPFGADI
ncbi:Protein of unknown function [Thermobacillus xylanilyticus]|uniref:Uncharacterized protein n=1 Tax=Thermobacillus xylanilyticus TaxID=76633 RepID=A0ABN7S9U5_THEXY|nr:Protein of unknown function [Thermobacillus xylanilyticus]